MSRVYIGPYAHAKGRKTIPEVYVMLVCPNPECNEYNTKSYAYCKFCGSQAVEKEFVEYVTPDTYDIIGDVLANPPGNAYEYWSVVETDEDLWIPNVYSDNNSLGVEKLLSTQPGFGFAELSHNQEHAKNVFRERFRTELEILRDRFYTTVDVVYGVVLY